VVDYKDLSRLRRFLSERGKIEPRRKTGTCAAHQRSLNVALKRARQLALLPFTAEHIRVTGVVVRDPGAAPFRGSRPRPQEPESGEPAAAPAPADGVAASADGQAAASGEATAAPASSEAATPTAEASTPAADAPTPNGEAAAPTAEAPTPNGEAASPAAEPASVAAAPPEAAGA